MVGDGDPRLGLAVTQPWVTPDPRLGLPLLVDSLSLVVSSKVGAWLFGVLTNKLGDLSPCGWMLQNTPFADEPHSRGSQLIYLIGHHF
jgi:hypothetical protein